VFETVVESIGQVKQRRQLVFVTHTRCTGEPPPRRDRNALQRTPVSLRLEPLFAEEARCRLCHKQ